MHWRRRIWIGALVLALGLSSAWLVWGAGITSVPLPVLVQTVDGTVQGIFKAIKFTNGSITDNGDGTATINIGVPGNNGDVSSGTASTADGQLTIFSGAGGKTITEYGGAAGMLKTDANGVPAPATAADVEALAGDAGADGVTKGVATFTATDFNAAAGVVSLDFTNAQKATAAQPGFLSATDFADFASRAPGNSHYLTTTAEASLSAEANLGALSTGLLKLTVAGGTATPSTATGGVDYVTPAGLTSGLALKADTATTLTGTAPLTGGGSLAANRTLTCPTCTTNAAPLTPDLPVIGAGANAIRLGSVSGTTTIFGTVSAAAGAKTANKQVVFDASGNLVASSFDAGATGEGSASFAGLSGNPTDNTLLAAALDAKLDDTQLSTNTALGTSNTLLPTQNAVKSYVDTGLALKQNIITPGGGLATGTGTTWVTDSTKAPFLKDGGTTDLTGGANQQGKMQVLDSGRLQYTDGAATALVWTGYLLPPPLTYNISAGTCTGDGNGGKLTIDAQNQVVCAADLGAGGGAGTVTSILATSPIHVTGDEITTAGTITIDNAAANGTTKGAATFNANDFADNGSGVISLDYGNAAHASAGVTGFLTNTDWSTFNAKQNALGYTPVPNTRTVAGKALSGDVTLVPGDVGLGNVSNAAQLTRAANDFIASIVQKASPTTSDLVLIEDQADAVPGTKKWVTLGSLPGVTLTVKEGDTVPSVAGVTEIRVSNGTLTDEGGGVVTIATGGGAGGGGDASTNTASVAGGEVAVFAGTTGKLLGAAASTGIAKLTAGVLSVVTAPSGALVGTTDTQLLTNKDVALRIVPVASSTTFACDVESSDECTMTSTEATSTITIAAPTGTPRAEQRLAWRLTCTNGQAYSWDPIFHFPGDVTQPLTCPAGTTDRWAAIWNAATSTYDVMTVVQDSGTGSETGGHIVQYNGTNQTPQLRLNFTGAGVQVANNTGTGATDITINGADVSAYSTVQHHGNLPALTQRQTLNIVGAALAASDDAGNNRTNVTLSQSPTSAPAVVGTTRIVTLTGTGNQISVSTPSQDLSADPSWTIGVVAQAQLSIAKLTNFTSNGVLTTTAGNGTLAVEAPAGATGALLRSPMTTAGDLIVGGTSGVPARLAGAAGFLKGAVGSAPSYSTVNLASANEVTGVLGAANGGTGMAYFAVSGPLALRTFTFPDASATVLTSAATVTVAQGGTGAATLTGLVRGQGTSALTAITSSTTGQVLRVTGADTFAFGAVDLADSDAITGDLPLANLAQAAAASRLLGRGSAAGAGDWEALTVTSPLAISGMALTLGDVALGTGTSGNYVTDVTAGAGLKKTSSASEGQTIDLVVDSTKTGFLTAGALTCGAGTAGKAQVHTTPLQYCDNAATPALHYAAYGDDAGAATSLASSLNVVTSGADGTSGNLVKYAGNNKTVSTTSIAEADVVTAAGTLTNGAPVIGSANKTLAVGTKSGTTNEFSTVAADAGAKTPAKQVAFNPDGNLIATNFDVGGAGNAAGDTGQVQWNNATAFAGTAGLVVDATSVLARADRVTTANATGALSSNDGPVVACTGGASDVTLTLPAALTTAQSLWVIIKVDAGAGQCLVARAGSDTLNGAATSIGADAQWAALTIRKTSTSNWSVTRWRSTVTLTAAAAEVTGILGAANGGTGSPYFAVSGPTTSTKTYTFPDANATVLTSNAAVTIAQGGTGTGSTLTGILQGGASAYSAITSTTVGQVLRVTGANTFAFGALDLADSDAITGDLPYANLTAASAASRLLGRGSASGAGDWEELTVTSPLAISATALACATCTTNAAALTANQLIIGGGSQAAAALGSLGTATTVLHGNATGAPSFGAVLPADLDVTADNTTANATSGHHGLLPKLSGNASEALRGDGSWGSVSGGSTTGYLNLPITAVKFPTSNIATPDVSESWDRLLFDATTEECGIFQARLYGDYASAPVLTLIYSMTSASSGGVAISAAVRAVTPGDAGDAGAHPFATVNTCTDATVPGTVGQTKAITCALTNADNLAAGDLLQLQLCRATGNAADTATGDMEVLGATFSYTK